MRLWYWPGWGWDGYLGCNDTLLGATVVVTADRIWWSAAGSEGDPDTDVQTDTDIDLEFVVMDEEELERPYRVIIHNDDVTTFEFVINILVTVFELTFTRATHIAFETHNTGASYVCTLPLEEAKSKVFKAQFAARQRGFPLTFSIEPE